MSFGQVPSHNAPSPANAPAEPPSPSPLSTRDHPRNAALDGIRGLAVVLVLLFHFTAVGLDNAVGPVLLNVSKWGWTGVDLFFVLSGFLITGILSDAKGSRHYFKNFYARRALRIFPAYYLLIALTVALKPLMSPAIINDTHGFIWGPASAYWLYVSNLYFAGHGHAEGMLSHTWSLAIEEQFYLVWPAVVYFCDRRRMIVVSVATIVGALLFRFVLLEVHAPVFSLYFLTITRTDELAMGGLVALMLRGPIDRPKIRRIAAVLLVLCPIAMAGLLLLKKRAGHLGEMTEEACKFSVISLLFTALLLLSVTAPGRTPLNRALASRPLIFFGRYSYGMYLFHFVIVMLVPRLFALPEGKAGVAMMYAVYLLSTIALALLSWHLYEKHFLKLKRLFPMEHHTTLTETANP